MAAAKGKSKMITLRSPEGDEFEVEEAVAMMSQTIRDMIEEDGYADDGIALPDVDAVILALVIEYCKAHAHAAADGAGSAAGSGVDLKAFDADFVQVDQSTLYGLMMAAQYLNIKGLIDLAFETVADRIKGKTAEEIRKTFNIKNVYTFYEEREVQREIEYFYE